MGVASGSIPEVSGSPGPRLSEAPGLSPDLWHLFVTVGLSAIIGNVAGYGVAPLSVLGLILASAWLWRSGQLQRPMNRLPRRLIPWLAFLWPLLVVPFVLMLEGPRTLVLGSPRLKGIADSLQPASDFTWATNGQVSVERLSRDEPDQQPALKLTLTLRADKAVADGGWGIDLLRHFAPFRSPYDKSMEVKQALLFEIKGEKGGEKIGLSMKSDRQAPTGRSASSDEERVPLTLLGRQITTDWTTVKLPLYLFYNVDRGRVRNLAFYVDLQLLGPAPAPQVIFLRRIRFQ